MRILILTPRLPWPPLDGGRVAMSRLASSLSDSGAVVEIVSLNPLKHRNETAIQAVDINTSRIVVPALRALTSGVPYIVARFVSRKFREAVREAVRRFRPDVVQIESPFLLPYAADVSGARVVLRSLNVEFRIWEGLARIERNPLRRMALRRVASSLRKYELREMAKLDAIIPISEDDASDFRDNGCTVPMHVVPCGVDPSPALRAPSPRTRGEGPRSGGEGPVVGFIGSLDFLPNRDAAKWILDELAPRLPGVRISIAGSSPPDWLRRRAEVQADVDDPNEFMGRMSIIIAPLFAGGGMRIKVLEAMALGKPVVATTIGAGGIGATHDRDILIADDADAFAAAVMRLIREPETAARIGAAARAMVAERYDSGRLARGLISFYESL